ITWEFITDSIRGTSQGKEHARRLIPPRGDGDNAPPTSRAASARGGDTPRAARRQPADATPTGLRPRAYATRLRSPLPQKAQHSAPNVAAAHATCTSANTQDGAASARGRDT